MSFLKSKMTLSKTLVKTSSYQSCLYSSHHYLANKGNFIRCTTLKKKLASPKDEHIKM